MLPKTRVQAAILTSSEACLTTDCSGSGCVCGMNFTDFPKRFRTKSGSIEGSSPTKCTLFCSRRRRSVDSGVRQSCTMAKRTKQIPVQELSAQKHRRFGRMRVRRVLPTLLSTRRTTAAAGSAAFVFATAFAFSFSFSFSFTFFL